jgi:hypothetical protein
MAIDLSGGLPPSADRVMAQRPSQRDVRQGVSMWISDDAGRFGFPRMGVEAIGSDWERRMIQANIAFPDGRVLIGSQVGEAHPVAAADGPPRIFGGGPLQFECVEPFRRWNMKFRGNPVETTVAQQMRGVTTGPSRQVEIELDAEMAVPPWVQGTMSNDARNMLESNIEGLFMGGERHEQLFRARGSFRVAGEKEVTFTATGLRINRIGVRNVSEFWGHCWQSAVFPSGKAFGYIAYPPRPDGTTSYNEGYIFDGTKMIPAKVIEAPWLTRFVPLGGVVDLVLETVGSPVRLKGMTNVSTFIVPGKPVSGGGQVGGMEETMSIPLHQGGARYEWDSEMAYGMIERSNLGGRVTL